ncbi:MAG: enoyl-CoA hydratase-related protein [Chloroflexota bacterium]|nr:enoyl-CoA hydratase-related protein [Chloroflexota bacterium]MDE2958900.1 enoyl-CoA hydratase-related protein [Chloroflexota bacterium]
MHYQTIRCDRTRFRATVILPRADSGVTIGEMVAEELADCCSALRLDDDLRVVMITGGGDTFATGREKLPHDLLEGDPAERMAWFRRMGVANALAGLPMPVLAILNGDAIAHGLEIALAADLRIAVDNARLGAGPPAQVGFPFDGMTQRLPRLAGPALARDMLLTGRALSASEALDFSLVNRVVTRSTLEATVGEMVEQIIAAAPIAVRYAKEAVNAAGDLPLAQGLRLEADLSIILQSTDDRAEGLRSFAEKRTPHFTGR